MSIETSFDLHNSSFNSGLKICCYLQVYEAKNGNSIQTFEGKAGCIGIKRYEENGSRCVVSHELFDVPLKNSKVKK